MKAPAIVLLSAAGREDVATLHLEVLRSLWPRCPFAVRVETGEPESGWTRRLLSVLDRVTEEILLLNLDDYVPFRPPHEGKIIEALQFLSASPTFASVYLDRSYYRPERDLPGLSGFGTYDSCEPLYKRTTLLPVLARVEAWKKMAREAVAGISETQDAGWVGAYNFELRSARPSLAFEVAAPLAGPREGPLAVIDLVQQDAWMAHGLDFLSRLGIPLPPSARKLFSGESPYMKLWRERG